MEISKFSVALNSDIFASPEWEEPFTEQELLAIDAIEAAYQSPPTSSSSSSSSFISKRKLRTHQLEEEQTPKTRRQLPYSLLSLSHSKPFTLSPCQDSLRMRYPTMRFGGQILYSRTASEVDRAARQLLEVLEDKRRESDPITVGFDIEWKPTFVKGALPGKVAVMQICIDRNHCHVMHVIHSGIPLSLQFLLEDSTLLKVGVGISNDTVKVLKDYNVSVKDVEDLSSLANQKLGGDMQKWSLASLTEILICRELEKTNKIRLGNWEADVLSKEQLLYAATDAFASWHLYQILKDLPDKAQNVADKRSESLKGIST